MNSWANAQPGWLTTFNNGRLRIYRAQFTPRAGFHDMFELDLAA